MQLIGSFANGTSDGVAHPHNISVAHNMISDVGTYSHQGSCYWQAIAGSIADEPPNHIHDNTCFSSARHGIEINDGERNTCLSLICVVTALHPVTQTDRFLDRLWRRDGVHSQCGIQLHAAHG